MVLIFRVLVAAKLQTRLPIQTLTDCHYKRKEVKGRISLIILKYAQAIVFIYIERHLTIFHVFYGCKRLYIV